MKCNLCGKYTQKIISPTLRGGEKRNVYYCEQCMLGMLDVEGLRENLKDFYDKDYRKKHKPTLDSQSNPDELFETYVSFQKDRIALLKKYANKQMRLLEIGCSAGMFLFHARDYVHEVVGLDYDSKSAEFATEKCHCQVIAGGIEDADFEEESFDIICLFQTLEHIQNPVEFIAKVKKYLKPHGIIHIEVPNLHDALVYAYNLPNHHGNFYFHSAHYWYFTKKSLLLLMEQSGFKGEIVFTQDYNVLNHMHWISSDAPQQSAIAGLSAPRLPLRETLEREKRAEMDSFIQDMDKKYKDMLIALGLSSNISFIGKKHE